MTDPTQPSPTNSTSASRARSIGAAGGVILLLSAGSALLPLIDPATGSMVIAVLLLAAGITEIFAGIQRHETRILAVSAGAVTTAAGLLFLLDLAVQFSPTVIIIIGWLLLRSLILLVTSRRAHGSVRLWIGLSAATDLVLAILLLAGLSISSLIVSLFGPTPALVASFAWIFALSFVVTGALLLQVANCEREPTDSAATT